MIRDPKQDNNNPIIRCAIYTRKSTDENLDSDFNSLDAQRESCEHFIQSHARENWHALDARYDDGAYSGASMERPGLKRLLADIEDGKVDCVVVYKIDRLSRSIADFTRMMEFFKHRDITMVSVTQAFNTNTSSGTLMVNLLMTFASYEREVIAERIRDKVAASKKRGKYMGGVPPLGYDVDRDRKRLVVNSEEAALVRFIFRRYLQLHSAVALIKKLNGKGLTTKSWVTKKGIHRKGRAWNKSHIYRLLNNPIYAGKIKHKDRLYEGEHEAIIEKSLWDEVQSTIGSEGKAGIRHNDTLSPLKGILVCGHCRKPMGATFTTKDGKRYRYYLCQQAGKSSYDSCPIRSVPAGDLENLVHIQVRRMLGSTEIAAETFRELVKREAETVKKLEQQTDKLREELSTLQSARKRLIEPGEGASKLVAEERIGIEEKINHLTLQLASMDAEREFYDNNLISEHELAAELQHLDTLWNELFPGEKTRIIKLLVDEIIVNKDGIDIALKPTGVEGVALEMSGGPHAQL